MPKRKDISKSRLKKGTLVEIVLKEGIDARYNAPCLLQNYYRNDNILNKPGARFVGYLMEIDRDFDMVKISQGYNLNESHKVADNVVSIGFNAIFSYQLLKEK